MLQPLLFTSSDSHQFYVFFFFYCPTGHSSAGLCISVRRRVQALVPRAGRPVQCAQPVQELAALKDLSKCFVLKEGGVVVAHWRRTKTLFIDLGPLET